MHHLTVSLGAFTPIVSRKLALVVKWLCVCNNLIHTLPSLAFSWAFWYWLTSLASLFSLRDSTNSSPSEMSSCAMSSLLSVWHRVTQSMPAFLYSTLRRHCLLSTSTWNSWIVDRMSSSWEHNEQIHYHRVTTFQTTWNSLTFPVEVSKDYPVSSVYRYGQPSLFHINEKQGEAR